MRKSNQSAPEYSLVKKKIPTKSALANMRKYFSVTINTP